MGNLHGGHLALIERARSLAEIVVLSIFVNPIQFNNQEDYTSYPKTLEHDLKLSAQYGVDYVFVPEETVIYPPAMHPVLIDIPGLTQILEGKYRPGHFAGVLTIINILFNLIRPHYAVFGEKDFQQLLLVTMMTEQLHISTSIISIPTIRENNGLAMSSRNVHLSAPEKIKAGQIYQILIKTRDTLQHGINKFTELNRQGTEYLEAQGFKVDYFNIVSGNSLSAAKPEDTFLVILVACHLGKTRLIDSMICRRK